MANGPRSIRRSLFATRCSLLAQSQFCFVQTAEDRGRIALLSSVLCPPLFAGLVDLARRKDPIPSRTRPSNALAPMVLCLKTWESRSSPGLQRTEKQSSSPSKAVGNRQSAVEINASDYCLLPTASTRGGAAR